MTTVTDYRDNCHGLSRQLSQNVDKPFGWRHGYNPSMIPLAKAQRPQRSHPSDGAVPCAGPKKPQLQPLLFAEGGGGRGGGRDDLFSPTFMQLPFFYSNDLINFAK